MGLSQTDTAKLFGEPAKRQNLPPSQIWIYHSVVCDLKMFFYPEVGGPAFRALTIHIDDHGMDDATHKACLSSLAKLPAG
jgi:hypothetical protein